ncbi:hypothetical protein LJC00_00780 [Dysgonomonas sp. OttesenSCG-928-M03]|nr:hypothetical protein [Dysgonomonas sp. OttesenSCG-928-M03]
MVPNDWNWQLLEKEIASFPEKYSSMPDNILASDLHLSLNSSRMGGFRGRY